MSEPVIQAASGTTVGKTCPHCEETIVAGAPCVSCPSCCSPQHASCWERAGASCASYFCSPETRRDPSQMDDAIVITRDETENPPPPPAALPRRPAPSPIPVRTDPYATAALVIGLLSLPLLGCVSGPVALTLGAVAFGRTSSSAHLRGRWRALAGFALGVLGTVGWIGGGLYYVYFRNTPYGRGDSPFLTRYEMPVAPSERYLANVPGPVRGALNANVFVQTPGWIGSGIVVKTGPSSFWVLTNAHVALGEPPQAPGPLTVSTIQGKSCDAHVSWTAPDGIDIALLEVELPGADQLLTAAHAASRTELPQIGSRAFAIGNPHSLAWSYTEGAVSSLREHSQGGNVLTFIQTQAPINPGNSGGGLYDMQGRLIGMNTWKVSESIGEGLGFAISVTSILEQRPDLVEVADEVEAPR